MPYGGAPLTNVNDALKFLVGDQSTSSATELLSTGECNYLLAKWGSPDAAAPYAAEAIAADFADKVSKSVGDLRIDAQQQFEHYTMLAGSLRRAASFTGVPYAGGISRADKQSVELDTDRVAPSFKVGVHDNPLVGSTST
jgi:hypothetical protein